MIYMLICLGFLSVGISVCLIQICIEKSLNYIIDGIIAIVSSQRIYVMSREFKIAI